MNTHRADFRSNTFQTRHLKCDKYVGNALLANGEANIENAEIKEQLVVEGNLTIETPISNDLMNQISSVPTRHFLFQSGRGAAVIPTLAYVSAFGINEDIANAFHFRVPLELKKVSMLFIFEEIGPPAEGGKMSIQLVDTDGFPFGASTSTAYDIGLKTIDTGAVVEETLETPLPPGTKFIVRLVSTSPLMKTIVTRIVLYWHSSSS